MCSIRGSVLGSLLGSITVAQTPVATRACAVAGAASAMRNARATALREERDVDVAGADRLVGRAAQDFGTLAIAVVTRVTGRAAETEEHLHRRTGNHVAFMVGRCVHPRCQPDHH